MQRGGITWTKLVHFYQQQRQQRFPRAIKEVKWARKPSGIAGGIFLEFNGAFFLSSRPCLHSSPQNGEQLRAIARRAPLPLDSRRSQPALVSFHPTFFFFHSFTPLFSFFPPFMLGNFWGIVSMLDCETSKIAQLTVRIVDLDRTPRAWLYDVQTGRFELRNFSSTIS